MPSSFKDLKIYHYVRSVVCLCLRVCLLIHYTSKLCHRHLIWTERSRGHLRKYLHLPFGWRLTYIYVINKLGQWRNYDRMKIMRASSIMLFIVVVKCSSVYVLFKLSLALTSCCHVDQAGPPLDWLEGPFKKHVNRRTFTYYNEDQQPIYDRHIAFLIL